MSEKTVHAQCIIEKYKYELSEKYKKHFTVYYRKFDEDYRRYYCFPYLYSAMFYDPTPEQISFIGNEAEMIRYQSANDIMKTAPREINDPDLEKWKVKFGEKYPYNYFRILMIFGSAHPNGYFRQRCLEHFNDDECFSMVEHSLIRLNDWVPEVRRTALKTLAVLMRKDDAAKQFIDAMPWIEKLRRSERAKREANFSMDHLDAYLMEQLENDPDLKFTHPQLCYKLFALHPEPKYRGLMLHFYKREMSGELRCELEHIYMKMSGDSIPNDVLEMFMTDPYDQVRIVAYEYRLKNDGLWEGFEKLLLSHSWRIRRFARKQLEKTEFDILGFCRSSLPQSITALGDIGNEEDIPLIRPYLGSHPAEAMYALAKLGSEDRKEILLKNIHSRDAKRAKSAYRIARSLRCFEKEELLPMIKAETNDIVQWRLMMLLTKDGKWNVLPYFIRFMRDYHGYPQYNNLLWFIKDLTGKPAYITRELKDEIQSALAYARETNSVPYDINNQIFQDMIIKHE